MLGGDHEFKVGVEPHASGTTSGSGRETPAPGARATTFSLLRERCAVRSVALQQPVTSDNNLNTQNLFARDNWLMNDRLTLSLGIRFERYDSFLPAQSKEAGPYSPAQTFDALDVYDWRKIVRARPCRMR